MSKTSKSADIAAQARAIVEEELGEFRPFADLPASAIEAMAARLVRALTPVLTAESDAEAQRSAA